MVFEIMRKFYFDPSFGTISETLPYWLFSLQLYILAQLIIVQLIIQLAYHGHFHFFLWSFIVSCTLSCIVTGLFSFVHVSWFHHIFMSFHSSQDILFWLIVPCFSYTYEPSSNVIDVVHLLEDQRNSLIQIQEKYGVKVCCCLCLMFPTDGYTDLSNIILPLILLRYPAN